MASIPRFGIICDDVRVEDNGKLLLIGVYSRNIVIPKVPAALVLSLVVMVDTDKAETTRARFELELNEKKIAEAEGSLKISAAGQSLFPIKNIIVNAEQVGQLTFKIAFGDGNLETISNLPIELRPT